jgi:peptidoglycan/LPS O-acetylase OafA/YrhL
MIKQIQILRSMAALWVVVFHGALLGVFSDAHPWVVAVINVGYAGVDVFFVISGVIMAHSARNMNHGPRAATAFMLTRFSRIYAGWWPAMLLYVIYLKLTQQLGSHLQLQASFFLYISDLVGLVNIAIWSLMFELYFYVTLSIGLLFPKEYRQRFLKLLFAVLVMVNICMWVMRADGEGGMEPNWIQLFYVAPLVAEFFMGYFLYQYLQRDSRTSWKPWGLLAIVWIALIVYAMPHYEDYPYGLANFHYWPERAVLMGGAALAIVGMALKLPSPRSKMALVMVKFGDYSYAIYLLHILAFNMMLTLLPWSSLNGQIHLMMAVVVILALLLVSAAYYHWVEHPVYMFCRQQIKHWLYPHIADQPKTHLLYKTQQPR